MDIKAIEVHLNIIGNRKSYCIFGGRPEWDSDKAKYSIPRNSPKKRTEWVLREKIGDVLDEYYKNEWTVWVSLNDKETGVDTIQGVRSVSVFWFDFDAPRKEKGKPADDEEKEVARKDMESFRKWMSDVFSAVGFAACSGNGYHLFFPINEYTLPGKNFRKEFNEKQRTLFKKLRKESGVGFDTTTDIKRVTQPIGGVNYKIPNAPLKTYWIDIASDKETDNARSKNATLLEAVLNTDISKEVPHATTFKHPKFEELTKEDEKLRDLYDGDWKKYFFKSRSEAEASLVTILCLNGFSDVEIKEVMQECGIGKWQEKEESYYNVTIRGGREFAAQHPKQEKQAKSDGQLQDTEYYLNFKEKKDGTREFVGINEKLFADDLTVIYHFKTIQDTEEVLFYEEGYYHYEGAAIIGAECERVFGKHIKTKNVAEILNHIRRSTFIKRNELNMDKSILPLENGLFDLTTYSIKNFNPDVIITYKLPVEYNPDADCPNINKFIDEILNPGDVPIIQEYFGYTLLPSFPAHKSLWLYGIGRNGKSQLTYLLSKMLGDENTVSVPIEELDGLHRFSTARLFGKLVNIVSEPGVTKPLKSGLFKKVIGGDKISAEIKGKQQTIDFINFSKFIVLGNIFPQVTDPSVAFWDRLIVVEFPNSFVDTFIPDIAEKLIEEDGGLSGFFNWCLEGLKRLKGNGFQFTTSKNVEEMKLEFEKLSNPVMAFIKEECIVSADKIISKGELYNAYKEYCGDGNYKITGKADFSKQIGEIRSVDGTKAKYNGKSVWCWRGMALGNEDNENAEKVDKVDKVDTSIFCSGFEEKNIKEREDMGNVNNVNFVNSSDEKHKTNIPTLTCICGKQFDTVEVLRHHQANCRVFQHEQDMEARE